MAAGRSTMSTSTLTAQAELRLPDSGTTQRVNDVNPHEDDLQSATERLLEGSWERRERRASRRELIVDAIAAALFVLAVGSLLLFGGADSLRPGLAILLIAVYALVG